ncbi:MFS transporter [Streptomyces phytohabitans]|uniref:MFS transporter n=1 Tax=Streptomyces phytohabitans TaxID=1150371 RepID=UPI00345BD629
MRKHYSLSTYLAGAASARTGDETAGPALLLAGFALTGTAAGASALLAAVTVAAAVGGPVLGVLLDRAVRPGRLLAGALALHTVGLAAVLAGLGRLPFGTVLLLAVATGLLGPALSGGWTAQLPYVVRPERLPRANALDAATFGAAGLAGPALAGVVAQLLGAPVAVAVSVALIGLAVPSAWRLPARTAAVRPARGGVRGDLAAGARCLVRRPRLARATLSSVVSCAGQGVFVGCAPLLGERVLGGAGHGALLLSCTAASALAANAVLARRRRPFAPDAVLRAGALTQAGAMALAVADAPAALVAAALLAGLGEGPQLAALFAVRHAEAPERLRGQLFTTGASLKITGFALGAAAVGPLAAASPHAAPAAAACLHLLAVAACLTRPRRRTRPGSPAAR